MDNFEVACGSVIGKDHVSTGKVLVGRNNQDAYAVRQTDDLIVAVVCDGCGSGKHSEVGAWLGANMIATSLAGRVGDFWCPPLVFGTMLERIRRDVLAAIRVQANFLGGSFSRTINDFFLFTVVGVVVDRVAVYIFAIGDGAYVVRDASSLDGKFCSLGPFPDNSPPYLAYDLVESSIDPGLLKFKVEFCRDIDSVNVVAIGSDGLDDLYKASDALIPGCKDKVGSFEQFWEDDGYFTNPEAIGRKLRRMNSDVVRVDKSTGRKITFPRLLADDTTLVVIRRKKS